MSEQTPPDETHRVGITITRVFAAPRERVWQEWTEPAAFADWFGGRDGHVPLESVSMDVRPGGTWSLTMIVGPDHHEIQWHGEYREVVRPQRLVLTFADDDSGRYELVVVDLETLEDGRTRMTFEQRGQMTPEDYTHARSGWSQFLDRLDERLRG